MAVKCLLFVQLVYFLNFGSGVNVEKAKCDAILSKQNARNMAPCSTGVCFLFRTEKPVVVIDSKLKVPVPNVPFKCSRYRTEFNGLSGPFFKIVDSIPQLDNAYCIHAPYCSFDAIVKLVELASNESTKKLQLVAGGMLFQMSYRVSLGSIQSASFYKRKMVIVRARPHTRVTFREAVNAVVGPFGSSAWWLLFGILLLFAVSYLWISIYYSPSYRKKDLFASTVEPLVPKHWLNVQIPKDENRLYLLKVWKSTAFICFFIVTIFYEISLVNFVINSTTHKLDFPLRSLREEQLKKFIVKRDSALEFVLRSISAKNYSSTEGVPWELSNNFDESLDAVLNPKSEVKFALLAETSAKYGLNSRGLCSKLALFEQDDSKKKETSPLFTNAQTTWYYSVHIPQAVRTRVDKELLILEERNKIEEFVDESISDTPQTCGMIPWSIGVWILFIPLFFAIGPFFLYMFIILTVFLVRGRENQGNEMVSGNELDTMEHNSSSFVLNNTTYIVLRKIDYQN